MLAEELGYVLMGHRLVESTEPAKPAIGLLEPRRHFYEREARAFAGTTAHGLDVDDHQRLSQEGHRHLEQPTLRRPPRVEPQP